MRRLFLAVAAFGATATTAAAQANPCPRGTLSNIGGVLVPDRDRASQDACQMAVDVFQFMAPQLGVALAGGNATLGQGGTLGGLGHFSIGIRGNVIQGDLPDVRNFPQPSDTGSSPHTLPSKTQVLGLPTVDAALGIFQGLPLGLTNVGGIDLLVSAAYIPTVGSDSDSFQIKPKDNLKFGYGARVGLLQESLLVPGVSVTYLKRDLPKTSLFGRSTDVDITVTDAEVKTTAWRAVASKSLLMLGVAGGVGQDTYDASATAQATVKTTPVGAQQSKAISLAQKMTRTNYFLDLYFKLPLFKLVGEIGQATGGTVSNVVNTFTGGKADKSRVYGSAGLTLSF